MSKRYKAKDFLKTEKIITFSPDEVLSKALASLNSGHDAAFVVNSKDILLGVVSPYYVQFHGNFPPATKLQRCMMMPPKLSLNSSLERVVRSMLESKMYFLPVLDDKKKLLGIVSLRRILKRVFEDKNLYEGVEEQIKIRNVTTVTKKSSLGKVRSILKKGKISRLPIVDNKNKLVGLITRYDLRRALSDPKHSQGFSKKGRKEKVLDTSIEGFMKTRVKTIDESGSLKDAIETMMNKRIGSVVIVDKKNLPSGIITYREVIKALLRTIKTKKYSLHMSTPKSFRYKKDFKSQIKKKLSSIENKLSIEAVDVRLVSGKDFDLSDKWFETSIRIETKDDVYFSQDRAEGWRKSLVLVFKKLSAQIR
ncbi:CBS domain-containing protein [Patescibacteria group bacterium]